MGFAPEVPCTPDGPLPPCGEVLYMLLEIGFPMLLIAASCNIWAKLQLLHKYRVAEYLSTPRARLLYWSSRVSVLFMGAGILMMTYASGLWWVEVAGWLINAYIFGLLAWATYMRLSGKHVEYYRAHQWR